MPRNQLLVLDDDAESVADPGRGKPARTHPRAYRCGMSQVVDAARTFFDQLAAVGWTMLGIGLAFQIPIGLLALQRLGAINASTLTRNWRYATVIIAVIAAAMPGADPVSTGLEMLPLVILYLLSIVLLKIADRRAAARAAAELSSIDDGLDPT